MLYLLSAWCFNLFVPLWHDIRTASAFVSPIQGRPCGLHLLLLCQTMTRAHGQPGFTQHPRRKTQHAKHSLEVGCKQCFICLFDAEWKGTHRRVEMGNALMMALPILSSLLCCIWNNYIIGCTEAKKDPLYICIRMTERGIFYESIELQFTSSISRNLQCFFFFFLLYHCLDWPYL